LVHLSKRKPIAGDAVRRVGRCLLRVTHKLIVLAKLEAGGRDVETFFNVKFAELGEFNRQPLLVPASSRGNFVVGRAPAFSPRLG
jgi:hypothetical protein